MRVLVLQHDEDVPLGHLGDWLAVRGADVEISRAWERGAAAPPQLERGYDLIIMLGSRHAAHDDSLPWLAGELELIRAAHARELPTLGICFGSQAIARALGGSAHRAATLERAWLELDTTDGLPEGPWLCWHYDTFDPPPGADVLARSDAYPHGYQLGHTIAVQFHPEVTPAIVDGWLQWSDDVGEDADALRERTAAEADGNRERAHALFDALWARVAHG